MRKGTLSSESRRNRRPLPARHSDAHHDGARRPPGLDPIRSISTGGAHVTGIAYDASGAQIGTYDYDWYETDLSNVIPGTTWTDARTGEEFDGGQTVRAAAPLASVVRSLTAGFTKYGTDEELQRYLRDVEDHLTLVIEQIDGFRQLLRDILTVNATLVAQQQNEEMKALTEASIDQNEEVKRISAWAAILFAPTLIGTVYGMNFDKMPELHWHYGYPAIVVATFLVCVWLYLRLKRTGWL